ncbi:MAG: 2Fe-2S iron-sulfur cluster binding domain-containing protein [Thiohalocapsa sp.]|uniref:2Fe-2S iron-sulfur cluster-binding protein n=1 Tax=Thiohalocapsa sp. TaxID=2497641 RepID=UPI0025FC42DE|nr:2Fe-2S iron-sulfur cluster-binding protein [Thiohalocapsa sp.]MCG6939813.1 2Fe-2S iron-sulfur cluster binding domain-containing protein [Thiohalocapsa sp.]
MTQLLSLSRAARLAGVTRAELQRRIRNGEATTFEGEIEISDLLRLYPRVSLEKTGKLEQVEQIKAAALPRSHEADTALPSPQVLLARLRSLGEALARKAAQADAQAALIAELRERLADSGISNELSAWLDARCQEIDTLPPEDSRARLFAKDTFLRLMSANVKLIPSGHEFFVDGTESILEAAVRAGVRLGYGCASGNCGECKARVVSGEVARISEHDYVLSEREKQMGYMLTCCNTAVTDVVLEAAEARTTADLPQQDIRAQIRKLEPEGDDLLVLHVQTPRTHTLRFMAGQRALLTLENDAARELPIASCPCNGRNLQFLVRRDDDAFGAYLFDRHPTREMIQVQGPVGDFVLREEATEPAVFVAIGDGIAPIKSLIEHAVSIDQIETFHLYWSVDRPGGHYHQRWCRALKETLDNFAFTPLVDARSEDLVAMLRADLAAPEGLRYYLAGPAATIRALAEALAVAGIPAERISAEGLG